MPTSDSKLYSPSSVMKATVQPHAPDTPSARAQALPSSAAVVLLSMETIWHTEGPPVKGRNSLPGPPQCVRATTFFGGEGGGDHLRGGATRHFHFDGHWAAFLRGQVLQAAGAMPASGTAIASK